MQTISVTVCILNKLHNIIVDPLKVPSVPYLFLRVHKTFRLMHVH